MGTSHLRGVQLERDYIIEAFVVLLFIVGIVFSYKQRFFKMLLAWFACDLTLHLILGFAVTEVYIMTSGWAFIIPIPLRLLTETIIDEMAKSDACDVNHANHLPLDLQCRTDSLLLNVVSLMS